MTMVNVFCYRRIYCVRFFSSAALWLSAITPCHSRNMAETLSTVSNIIIFGILRWHPAVCQSQTGHCRTCCLSRHYPLVNTKQTGNRQRGFFVKRHSHKKWKILCFLLSINANGIEGHPQILEIVPSDVKSSLNVLF